MARALYIHWPFCLKKCPYCDFNSHVRDGVDADAWQAALIADMRHEARVIGGAQTESATPKYPQASQASQASQRSQATQQPQTSQRSQASQTPLSSIFFGGGTPSLMPPRLVEALLAEAERLWGFDADIEITLEANPSSVEAAKFADLAQAGVNRVSLGLQSLDDQALRFLGRLHSAAEGVEALEIAQRNFGRVSFDLIYALPDQSAEDWRAELDRALGFGTDHLSLYQLTIEPNTRFASDVRRNLFAPMADDPAADLFELTRAVTAAAGLPAYEVSNFARAGQQSRHNLTYWRYHDYLGIGPGAHGRRAGMAVHRHKKPENYLAAIERQTHGIQQELPLSPAERAAEALMMGLRLEEGVDLSHIEKRCGVATSELLDPAKLEMLQRLNFVTLESVKDTKGDERDAGDARDAYVVGDAGVAGSANDEGDTGAILRVTPQAMGLLDAILADLIHPELVAA